MNIFNFPFHRRVTTTKLIEIETFVCDNPGIFQNLQGLQAYNRPKRDVPAFESLENDLEIEKLYRGMILLSKYYAMYKNV